MGVMCVICDKWYSNQSNLNKHTKKVHNLKPKIVTYDKSKYMYKCLEKNCNRSFRHNVGLKNHLTDEHKKQIECVEKEFSNKEDFLAWKRLTEKRNSSSYVLSSTSKYKNKPVKYYLCNRSGKAQTKSLNKRLPKSQGSCKLNRYCISMIKLIEGEKLLVTWIKTHYGHTIDLQHLRLSQMDKSIVASKLIMGVPPSRILDSFRDRINEEDLSREDLITRKDIQNIKKAYHMNISEGVKQDNDAISVDMRVNQLPQENKLPESEQIVHKEKKMDINLLERNVVKCNVLRENFSARIFRTMSKLQCTDENTLDDEVILKIQNHLDKIDDLLDLPSNSTDSFIPTQPNEPVHRKIEKQTRFFSTQKKRKTIKNRCKKPTALEVAEIKADLKSNFKQLIYVSSNSLLDHDYLL